MKNITLTIVEKITTRKLIRKKTQDIKRDSLAIKYDYRTGRWSGDDNFDDKDGYGHYIGKTFEIWFNVYQMDSVIYLNVIRDVYIILIVLVLIHIMNNY